MALGDPVRRALIARLTSHRRPFEAARIGVMQKDWSNRYGMPRD
jgi:hypothetical protein